MIARAYKHPTLVRARAASRLEAASSDQLREKSTKLFGLCGQSVQRL